MTNKAESALVGRFVRTYLPREVAQVLDRASQLPYHVKCMPLYVLFIQLPNYLPT